MLDDKHCLYIWLHQKENRNLLLKIRNKVADLYRLLIVILGGVWCVSLYCMLNEINTGVMFVVWAISMILFMLSIGRVEQISEGLDIDYGLFMNYLSKEKEKLFEYQKWKVEYLQMKSRRRYE